MWDLRTVQVCLCVCLVLAFVTKPSFGAGAISTFNENPLVLQADPTVRSQSVESPSEPLQPKEILTRRIKGGETRTFFFKLNAGELGELAVHWKDIDLNLFVRKPDQKLLFPTSISLRGAGSIPVIVLADQTGTFTVEVRTVEQVNISGSFDIVLSEPKNPGNADRDRFSALMLMTEGQAQEAKSLAIEKYTKALELWRSGMDTLGEAYALQRLANAYISSKDLENASKHYQALIHLRETLNDARSLIYTRREIGQDFRAFNSPTKAIEFYLPALQLAQQIKDRRAEAALLFSIGFAHQNIGHMQDALKVYEEALSMHRENHDRLSEARTLNAIGGAYNALGDQDKALSVFEQVTQLYVELDDPYRAGIAANNTGLAYDDKGDLQRAKDKYLEALAKFKSLLNNDMSVCKTGAPSQTLAICNSIANTSDNLESSTTLLGILNQL